MIDIPNRENCAEEQVNVINDLDNILVFADNIQRLALAAKAAVSGGQPEVAMRIVQRIRYQCQLRADFAVLLLDDLNFLSSGIDEFEHEAWMQAQAERDYSALDFALGHEVQIAYMMGADITGDRDE
tara:strand:+ start:927 stop:1307 length:381 start_codon:yes stop_codon:yes gene_type:complete